MKKFTPDIFYIFFFICNIFNSYILTYGLIHPNISNYSFNFSTLIFSLIGNLGMTLLFYSLAITIFPTTKGRIIFLIIISFIFTLLCLGLAIYANIFSTFFSFTQLTSFNNPKQGSFFAYYAKYALSMINDWSQAVQLLPFFLLIIIAIFTDKDLEKIPSPVYKILLFTFSLIFLIAPIIKLNSDRKKTIYEYNLNALYGANNVGLYDYYLYDFYNYLTRDDYNLTEQEEQEIQSFLAYYEQPEYINPIDNKTYSVENEYTGKASGKNLLFIQLEAFNNFLINLKVDGIEITPNLNKLANNGKYLNNFYSSAGIGNTSDAEFSALTGLYGNGNDLTIFDYAGSNYETLAKDFKKKGYYTFSAHGNDGTFYHRNTEHLRTLGFDNHYDINAFRQNNEELPIIHSYLDDMYFLEHLIDFMPEEKFFGYAITVTSHSPYVPTSEIEKHNFEGLTNLANNYLDFCMYVDEAIGNFIQKLEDANKLDDTILVFYGDHTSSLFKKDIESIFKNTYDDVSYRRMMQSVPLIIYNTDLFSPEVNTNVHGTVDLYRSFANLFDLESKYHFGTDIFSNEPGFIYSPRNLDLMTNEGVILIPTNTANTNNPYKEAYIQAFTKYKRLNDLILKSRYFK